MKALNKSFKSIGTCLLFLFALTSYKGENNLISLERNEIKHFEESVSKNASVMKISYSGKIDKYPIELEINIDQITNKIDGSYRYINNKNAEFIYIEGEIKNNKIILIEHITENNKTKKTGTFELNLENFNHVSGIWKNPNETRTYKVNIVSLEKFENRPQAYSFEIDLQKITKEKYPDNEIMIEQTQITNLKIYHEKKLVQTIKNLNSIILDDIRLIEMEDLNFDGYFDIKILEYFPERTKYDVGFRYYIYNPKTSNFVSNPDLDNLEYLTFNSFTKEFRKMYADGRGNESTEYYKWKGNSFKMVKKEEEFEDSYETKTTNYTY